MINQAPTKEYKILGAQCIAPPPLPNIKPQPRTRNPNFDTAKKHKILLKDIDSVFFDRLKPGSTMAKPRFIKNTNIEATITQIVSSITL